MSNISQARAALEAEIKNAQEGHHFYAARIAVIENILHQLGDIESGGSGNETGVERNARKRKSVAAKITSGKPGQKASKAKTSKTGSRSGVSMLPATNSAFWKSLLSTTPISNKELLAAAITRLGIDLDASDTKKLKQRVANAIVSMTKDGSMNSEGTGRDRRFSLG